MTLTARARRVIPIATLPKPVMGTPCNGCGHCCLTEVCLLGRELGDTELCAALIHREDGGFACGLVVSPYDHLPAERTRTWRMIDQMKEGAGESALRAFHADILGAGLGCDSVDR